MPFNHLHPQVQHHIVNSLGWPALRPVQNLSIQPIIDGHNAVILAPTAGGKTEAAFFPLMSQVLTEDWQGLSILYLSPIKALLNNQFERLEKLFGLIGYTVGIWHGDVSDSVKNRMRKSPPHVLLTTPESLEGMLISTRTAGKTMFGNLRAIVIDEVHAFAGDDRGWHLLGVLQRLSAYANRDIQRLGLSATVGNPDEIAAWLGQGSTRPQVTIDPPGRLPRETDVKLDWVATLENAAKVIALLHPTERRLVFCDSRIQAERLARELRARDINTHLTHSSLSADERARTEQAFAEGGPGVIVATSALELGIDIGNLDRVIQLDAPYSVASFLQRMGRTGRRAGTTANCLFLTITDDGLLRAAALLDMWKNNEVEPARAASAPFHILAQQMIAIVLEQPGLSLAEFTRALTPFCNATNIELPDFQALLQHLLDQQYLFLDGIRLGIGRTGESELGRRHFLEIVSVFTAPPVFKVMHNRREIGEVHQSTFLSQDDEADDAPRTSSVILLAGRSWRTQHIDWNRRIAYVEPSDQPGRTRFLGAGQPMTHMLARATHRVITGSTLAKEHYSTRARAALETLLQTYGFLDSEHPTMLRTSKDTELWNFAGGHANNYLTACLDTADLAHLALDVTSNNALRLRIDHRISAADLQIALQQTATGTIQPTIDPKHPMLRALKFSELLPEHLLQRAARARIFGDQPWHDIHATITIFEHQEQDDDYPNDRE